MERAFLAFAICATVGCGLDLGGELFVLTPEATPQGIGDSSAPDPPDRAVAPNGADDSGHTQGTVSESAPSDAGARRSDIAADTGGPNNDVIPAWADASGTRAVVVDSPDGSDAPSFADAADSSVETGPDAGGDGASACVQLTQCCDGLIMAGAPPPILAACLLQQSDGGDAGACDVLLGGFVSAGICP
jgi:hypothetical protein